MIHVTLHLKLDADDPTSREDVELTRWIVTHADR